MLVAGSLRKEPVISESVFSYVTIVMTALF